MNLCRTYGAYGLWLGVVRGVLLRNHPTFTNNVNAWIVTYDCILPASSYFVKCLAQCCRRERSRNRDPGVESWCRRGGIFTVKKALLHSPYEDIELLQDVLDGGLYVVHSIVCGDRCCGSTENR